MSVAIRSVVVARDGMWHADPNGHQTPESCARFRLSGPAALRWFRRAHEVARHEWLHELDWTQCSAEGMLTTGDGRLHHAYGVPKGPSPGVSVQAR